MSNVGTQFKKGQSGNPNGAPKRAWTWSGELQKALEKKTLDGVAVKQGVAESLIDAALQGNVMAIKEMFNRMDGMPKQDMALDGELTHLIVTRGEKDLDASSD